MHMNWNVSLIFENSALHTFMCLSFYFSYSDSGSPEFFSSISNLSFLLQLCDVTAHLIEGSY